MNFVQTTVIVSVDLNCEELNIPIPNMHKMQAGLTVLMVIT